MKNAQTISIAEVLAASQVTHEGSSPAYFEIKFAKDDGGVSIIKKASRGVKKLTKGKGAKTDMRAANLMLVYDHEAETHKHVTIALILQFNGTKVFH